MGSQFDFHWKMTSQSERKTEQRCAKRRIQPQKSRRVYQTPGGFSFSAMNIGNRLQK